MGKKYITTTLPYTNSIPHIGHCFEFVLADIIASYYRLRLGADNVFLNVGVDEHGQKVAEKAKEEGFDNPQDYCDKLAHIWKNFCSELNIEYNNFYRTTDPNHKLNVVKFYNQISHSIFRDSYTGYYCVGCEAFKTDKEISSESKCTVHQKPLIETSESNLFFDLKKYSYDDIEDILIDKSLSEELKNIIEDPFNLSITRKNVKWGINAGNDEVFYVWFDALTNYLFSIKYYEDREYFNSFWQDSLQICGKDNLKFQAYILQALLIAAGIPQTKELLVHGLILDKDGNKLSKTNGNVIDPVEQKQKFGLSALRYYLFFGLNTFSDSKYSEDRLIELWNNDIVNGLGNLISRTLHLIDLKGIIPNKEILSNKCNVKIDFLSKSIQGCFEKYDFDQLRIILNTAIGKLNKRITDEKPFAKDNPNSEIILNEVYFELLSLIPFYQIILKQDANLLDEAFEKNKKVILFQKK